VSRGRHSAPTYRFGCVLLHDLRCSNSCVFCRAGDEPLPDDLPPAAERRLHRDTASLISRGIRRIDVSGNEPLRYSKIVSYLRWIRPRFREIKLLDPGNLLEEEALAREVVEAGPDVIVLPLYGSHPSVHDACVRNDGAFRAVTRGIRHVLDRLGPRQRLDVSTLFLAQNRDDLPALARHLSEDLGVTSLAVNMPMATEEGVGRFFDEFAVSFPDLRRVVLEMAGVPRVRYHLRYVPPCLFSSRELRRLRERGGVDFFNAHFTYRLGDDSAHGDRLAYVDRYREQVPAEACSACALPSTGACDGILRMYLEANRDHPLRPVTASERSDLGDLLVYRRVNP